MKVEPTNISFAAHDLKSREPVKPYFSAEVLRCVARGDFLLADYKKARKLRNEIGQSKLSDEEIVDAMLKRDIEVNKENQEEEYTHRR